MKVARTGYIHRGLMVLTSLLLASCAKQFQVPIGSHYPYIEDLSWMIGEWTDTQDGKTITNVCRWSTNRNFITRTFEVTEYGQPMIEGTEIIGWDPAENLIRSWTFDSTGGTAVGIWRFQNDQWKIEIIEDLKSKEPSKRQQTFSELDWLIGSWVDDGGENRVESTCEWVGNKMFFNIRFTVYSENEPVQEGLVIIGWDEEQKSIRSWIFDTDGGLAEGTGFLHEDEWQMQNRHVLPDGRLASAISIYRKIDNDSFTWQRIAQEVEGELLPDMNEIMVIRRSISKNPEMEIIK